MGVGGAVGCVRACVHAFVMMCPPVSFWVGSQFPLRVKQPYCERQPCAIGRRRDCPCVAPPSATVFTQASNPQFSGKVSVPVLYDTRMKRIVNNQSFDAALMIAEFLGPLVPEANRTGVRPSTLLIFVVCMGERVGLCFQRSRRFSTVR